MKRDLGLVRRIMLELEQSEPHNGLVNLKFEDIDSKVVSHHVMIMNEGGLIVAHDLSTLAGPAWEPSRLTWNGHEFLDAARDKSVWKKVEEATLNMGGAVGFDTAFRLAKYYVTEKLRSIGIDLS